jgi:hypothetical protein
MAGEILGVARLLADEHEARGSRPFAEDCLRPSFVEIAGLTPCGGLSDTRLTSADQGAGPVPARRASAVPIVRAF